MRLETNGKVMIAAAAGLFSPDVISAFFTRIAPALEGLLRLGQFGVAVFTCLYIFRKWKAIPIRKARKKK